MDATTHSPRPDHDSARIFDEKLSEKTGFGSSNTSTNHLSVDTRPATLRNGASDTQAIPARTPDRQTVGEFGQSQHFTLRTLPAWIRSVEAVEDNEEPTARDHLLPSQPDDARVAQHNHAPSTTSRPDYFQLTGEGYEEGRSPSPERESRWKTFSRAIQYPREYGRETQEVTPEWLNDNCGDYSEPWRGKHLEGDSPEYPLHTNTRREIWFKRFHNTLLRSPMVPMILRMTVWCFSLSALALGGSIQHLASQRRHPDQGPSALMAIIVDAVALVYLVYITFDEYTSKPLGLRSPSAKARLILLDLFFIVFDSANLSLAFASLSEVTGSCTQASVNERLDPRNNRICERQKALASVLLIALLAWLMTFAISVLRLVERVKQ